MLLHSGRIYTQNPITPFYQAMIIADGKIAWLGNNHDLYAIPSDKYDIFDLGGRTVLPSFCDAHMHLAFWAFSLIRLDLDGCRSYREVLAKIRAMAANLKRGEWLVGKGWQPIQWKKPVQPGKQDLDKIIRNHPVALLSKDEHAVWVNSKTLKILGIDRNSADPAGGRIDRDPGGEPTGILLANAAELVYKIMPPPQGAKATRAIKAAQDKAHSLGITAVGSFDSIEGFAAVQKFYQEHGFKLRISQVIRMQNLDEILSLGIRTGFGDDRLRILCAKLYADGALGSQSAFMFKSYQGSKTDCGIAQTDKAELKKLIKKSIKGGLSVAVHAIGDRANSETLQAIIESSPKRARGLRHRIEHCQLLRKQDIPLFGKHGIIASVQPCHLISDIDLMQKYWGKRSRYAYAFKSLLKSGANLAFGSDAPIEKPNPIWNIYCAVTRHRPSDKRPFYPVERITVAEAVRAHTWGGAYSLGAENKFGSITIGNYADIVILDKDIHVVDPMDIAAVKVVATLFEGEIVYGKDSFDSW